MLKVMVLSVPDKQTTSIKTIIPLWAVLFSWFAYWAIYIYLIFSGTRTS